MQVHEAIVAVLRDVGVDVIFGGAGEESMGMQIAVARASGTGIRGEPNARVQRIDWQKWGVRRTAGTRPMVFFVGFDTLPRNSSCSPLAKSWVRRVSNVPPKIEREIREQRDALVAPRAVDRARGANRKFSGAKPLRSFLEVPAAP